MSMSGRIPQAWEAFFGRHGSYAGIGTRKLHASLSRTIMNYACCMTFAGYHLRSGGADGCDTSFETGARIALAAIVKHFNLSRVATSDAVSIYLGWPGFNYRTAGEQQGFVSSIPQAARDFTANYHPNWHGLNRGAQSLMARNACQVLGDDLRSPVQFVMCYTPDGAYNQQMTSHATGGTGQAIRIASDHSIPIYNLANDVHLSTCLAWIEQYDRQIQQAFGLSPIQLVDDYLASTPNIQNWTTGNLVSMFDQSFFDVLVHGCNIHHTMGTGIAQQIKDRFPAAYQADLSTERGNASKLGSFSSAEVRRSDGSSGLIINAYTQNRYGRDDVLYADYEAIKTVARSINTQFAGRKIGIPRIGAGAANGCWQTISTILSGEIRNAHLTLVDLPEAV